MKVCPSCNTRVADGAPTCTSCDHSFAPRQPKKTMMGLPRGDEDQENEDRQRQSQTLFGLPAVGDQESETDQEVKTAMVSAEDIPMPNFDFDDGPQEQDDSTRQVDPTAVADALGEMGGDGKATAFGLPSVSEDEGERQEEKNKSAASAWGIAESSAGDDAGSTQVMSPDMVDFNKLDDDAGSVRIGAQKDETEGAEGERQYETLMGFSLEESSGQDSTAGSMHRGAASDDEEKHVDVATQALSPDQLAAFEEMDFGSDQDDEAEPQTRVQSATEMGRLNPGTQTSADEAGDDLRTAVLDGPISPGRFQLQTPDQEPEEKKKVPSSKATAAPPTKEASQEEDRSARSHKDTPRSGVFRSARKRKKSLPPEGSTPQTGNLGDTGVTGTGTYRMSNTNTNSGSGLEDSVDDESLKIGAVGSGGRTSFPLGGSDSKEKEKVNRPAQGSSPTPLPGDAKKATLQKPGDEGDTGPRFSVGDSKVSAKLKKALKRESTQPAEAEQSVPTPQSPQSRSAKKESPKSASDSGPARPGGSPLDDFSLSGMLSSNSPKEEQVKTTPTTSAAAEPAAPAPEPAAPAPEPAAPAAEPAAPAAEPAAPAPEPAAPAPESAAPAAEPAAPSFGAEPAAPAPEPAAPSFGAEPSAGATPAAPASKPNLAFGAESAPASVGEEAPKPQTTAPEDAEQSLNGADVNQVITLIQKGFGALGGVVMMTITAVAVVMSGVPQDQVVLAVVAAPLVLGLMAFVLTALPVSQRMRSAGYGLIAMVALLGFAASMAAEMGALMSIGQFAGGLLLVCAAAFPLFGKVMGDS